MTGGLPRRAALQKAGGVIGVSLALSGCLGGGDGGGGLVVESRDYEFDPFELTLSVGETVTWEFVDPGHNVSCVPDHSEFVELPEGAAPFASYSGDNPGRTDPEGATYEYTFETAGEYHYVCIPHQSFMQGHLIVE